MILTKKIYSWLSKFQPGVRFKSRQSGLSILTVCKNSLPVYFHTSLGSGFTIDCLEYNTKRRYGMVIFDIYNNSLDNKLYRQNSICFV